MSANTSISPPILCFKKTDVNYKESFESLIRKKVYNFEGKHEIVKIESINKSSCVAHLDKHRIYYIIL